MPGKIRKVRTPRVSSRPVSKARPSRRSVGSRSKVVTRVKTNIARRSTNVKRSQNRIVKRQVARANANKIQPRPRPVVRPSSCPVKRMPKVSAPPTPARKSIRKPVRPTTRPSAPPVAKRMSMSKPVRSTTRPSAAPTSKRKGMRKLVRPVSQPSAAPRVTRPRPTSSPGIAGTLLALNAARAHPEISTEISSLQSTLADVQQRSTFSEIATDLTNLDADLNNVLNLLESARDRGYVYQNDLEDIAFQSMDRWQSVRGQVEADITNQSHIFQSNILDLNPNIQRLNAVIQSPTSASSYLGTTQSQANQVLWDMEKAESSLENSYDDIGADVHKLNARLTTIHWALDQVAESKISLKEKEGEHLVMAVPTRWDKEGKEDPEGILYLSNQRLIFEQKEKLATKKVLFLTTASELVIEVLIDQGLETLENVKAKSKGLFGHKDFMDISFSSGNLGTVVFHLNGQDSEQWINLIKRSKSGEIENERTTGAGISFSDLTGDLTNADLLDLQNEVNELQDEMMLKDVQGELAELENETRSLERDLGELRAKGYAVEKNLEGDIKVLVLQWDRIKSRADATLHHQVKLLGQQMEDIQVKLAVLLGLSANLNAARPGYIQLKSVIASAEAQADAAEDTVFNQYDEFADEVESLSTHFDWVDWMLAALSTASFRLMATESGVSATEAVWERPGMEPENGILFLTDQRILWEDRVDDYEMKIVVPVQQVVDVVEGKSEDGEHETLVFEFDSDGIPVSEAHFQLGLPVAEDWLRMVGRARAGDYLQDRAIEIDEAQLERIRSAPEQCPMCGAAFTGPVLRGQNEIVCVYCGVTTRL